MMGAVPGSRIAGIGTVLAMLAVVSCSSTSSTAGRAPATSTSTNTTATSGIAGTTTVSSTPQNSGCTVNAFSPPSWPKSSLPASVVAADAPAVARRFVATELGVADVAAAGGLKVGQMSCTVEVRVGSLHGIVNFVAVSSQRYAVEGFTVGEVSGASIQVAGRHVDARYDAGCSACTSWEMRIRYGDAASAVGPVATPHMTADLNGAPTVAGGYVFVDRLADGAVRSAHAITVPPGDFAAS